MIPAVLLLHASAQAAVPNVPLGFAVERASRREGAFLALAFDAAGALLVGAEDEPILRLVDGDRDGVFETEEVFCAALVGAQGLAVRGDEVFATARDGEKAGVWRIGSDRAATLVLPLASLVEHGPHGLAFGADGALLLACGDETAILAPPDRGMPLDPTADAALLPRIEDPLGTGRTTNFPYGCIARIDPATGAWGHHSIGLRNAYDLAVDDEGEVFAWDSDMEYDVGLPWYRPTRLVHARPGLDHGFRRGSAVRPTDHPASAEVVAESGRASPTGLAWAGRSAFPPPWRDAVFGADWANGRILAFVLQPRGATFAAEVVPFASGAEFASATDIAFGPDGALYVLRGGRGARGPVVRVAWRGEPAAASRSSRAGAADRATRRAIERLALRPAEPSRGAAEIPRLLAAADPAIVRAAQAALAAIDGPARTQAARAALGAVEARTAAQGLLALVRANATGFDREALDEWLGIAVRERDAAPAILAAIEHATLAGRVDRDALRAAIDAQRARPGGAALRILDDLDAWAGGRAALARFLDRAGAATDPVASVRAAWLAASCGSFEPASLARFLAWYESSRAWSGGASFRGYLVALRARAAADDATCVALLQDTRLAQGLAPAALAFLLRRATDLSAERRAELGASDAILDARRLDLESRHAAAFDAADRRAAIAEVDGTRDPALLSWLRDRARLSQEERGTALTALAHAGDPADAALFVEGLASDDLGTPRACSDVLRSLAPPGDPATWSRVHAIARATGHPRGWSALRVLAAWRGEALAPADPASFAEALLRAQADLRRRFPDLVIATDSTPRPARDADAIATFLARSDARPASAAAGREVFVRATCAACHTIGGSALVPALTPGASGPDLSGVSKRLKPRELFAAVARPSAEIPDRWRSTVVETQDGARVEGRVTREDARGLEITTTDGRATWIGAEDVAVRRASLVSAMPEGLLATITLEEVRDLFAFLRADGRVEGPEPGWRPLFGARVDAGWTGDFDLFALEDGVLVGRARDLSTPQYLLSDLVASDFELEFDVRLTRGTNSGLQYRSRVEPGNVEPVGYQADLGQIFWGALYASDGRGLIHEPDPRLWRSVVDVDGWNHVFVRVAGDRHVIEIEGQVLSDARDDRHPRGRFAWQLHPGPPMELRVANARVRVLDDSAR